MSIDIYIERGKTRLVAGALEWPGWCRVGRDEDSALQALVDHAPRYAGVLHAAHIAFHPPADVSGLAVAERLDGKASTDFGVPDVAPAYDAQPVDADELLRLQKILKACWKAFDQAAQTAEGKTLKLGPRGGGRDLAKITDHVLGAEAAYLGRLAWKLPKHVAGSPAEHASLVHQAALEALAAAARGETPEHGPRGGAIWSPRYFARRCAWHVLDHVWEIEDRVE